MPKEALQAYFMQRLMPDGFALDPVKLLYLATLAGAEALGLGDVTGSFTSGKAADLVYLRPPVGSPLAFSLEIAESASEILAAIFTQAGAESIAEVRVEGEVVHR
jgi:guanine deaminase